MKITVMLPTFWLCEIYKHFASQRSHDKENKSFQWQMKSRSTFLYSKRKSQRELLNSLATEWNIKSLDDWYSITAISDEISAKREFRFIKSKYRGNFVKALEETYPEHRWKPWKF